MAYYLVPENPVLLAVRQEHPAVGRFRWPPPLAAKAAASGFNPGGTHQAHHRTERQLQQQECLRRTRAAARPPGSPRPLLDCTDFKATASTYSWSKTDRSYARKLAKTVRSPGGN